MHHSGVKSREISFITSYMMKQSLNSFAMAPSNRTHTYVYSIGSIIAMCAAINHLALNSFFLVSYCAEVGCFQENCQTLRPNQCLPPRSDTYIPFSNSFGMYFRYYLAVTNSICVQAILESLMFHSAVWLVLRHSRTHIRYALTIMFDLVLIAHCVLEVSNTLVLNIPPSDDLHQQLAKYLPSMIVFVLVPIYIAILYGKADVSSAWTAQASLCGVGGVLLGLKLRVWTDHWSWYVQEWCLIALHGLLIMAMGMALPRTFVITFKREGCRVTVRIFSSVNVADSGFTPTRAVEIGSSS